jgi:hypothetical protein
MSAPKEEYLRINFKQRKAKGHVKLAVFQDGEWFVAYSPTFKLSGYGISESEAVKMFFSDVLSDFLQSLYDLPEGKGVVELKKLGFVKKPYFKTQYLSKAHIDKEGILRDFDLPVETTVHIRDEQLELA